jgi:hypothetical protein
MGCLEAVVVVYLRRIHYPDDPLSLFPMKIWSLEDLMVEIVREVATVAMILGAAALAERGRVRIFAAFALVFGIWDLAYYAWLKVFLGWPVSWAEWDILFLIPWAWLGPWITPAMVSLVLVAWGGRVVAGERDCRFGVLSTSPYPGGFPAARLSSPEAGPRRTSIVPAGKLPLAPFSSGSGADCDGPGRDGPPTGVMSDERGRRS